MNVSTWSIKGLNHPLKRSSIAKFLLENKVDLPGVEETKVKKFNLSVVANIISPSLKSLRNDVAIIIILWDEAILNVQVLSSADQVVAVKVSHKHLSIHFVASIIYGTNRRELRDMLRNGLPNRSFSVSDQVPWILLGDFNIAEC